MKIPIALALVAFTPLINAATPSSPQFHAVTIDDKIQIGYGLAIADVDGDKLPDVLLADKKQFVWYRNPGSEKAGDEAAWQKFIITENLTVKDNVCIAAQDIDGDGKCEIAVGAEWNPGDTENSGAVFYLIPPADRTQRWEPVKLHAEPTTHRMRWIPAAFGTPGAIPWGLVVAPLHGRGNKNGEGVGVKILIYYPPANINDPQAVWKTELIDDRLHMTHNISLINYLNGDTLLIGGREGMARYVRKDNEWFNLARDSWSKDEVGTKGGIGEIRESRPPYTRGNRGFLATVEPMHGNRLMVYPRIFMIDAPPFEKGILLTDKLVEGHALACGNLLGTVSDQIVVGWRGKPGDPASTSGLAIWVSKDNSNQSWQETVIDPTGMACEDLQLADMNGDGRLDIIASGRGTKNVKIYFNDSTK